MVWVVNALDIIIILSWVEIRNAVKANVHMNSHYQEEEDRFWIHPKFQAYDLFPPCRLICLTSSHGDTANQASLRTYLWLFKENKSSLVIIIPWDLFLSPSPLLPANPSNTSSSSESLDESSSSPLRPLRYRVLGALATLVDDCSERRSLDFLVPPRKA